MNTTEIKIWNCSNLRTLARAATLFAAWGGTHMSAVASRRLEQARATKPAINQWGER